MSKVKKEIKKSIFSAGIVAEDKCWTLNQKTGVQEVFRLIIFTLCMVSFKKRGLG